MDRACETRMELAQRCVAGWVVEVYSDLFAMLTAGAAYAWSHLHLSALYGDSPYAVPVRKPATHPADEARMCAILGGLRMLGHESDAVVIKARRQELKAVGSFTPSPEHAAFCPLTESTKKCVALASKLELLQSFGLLPSVCSSCLVQLKLRLWVSVRWECAA